MLSLVNTIMVGAFWVHYFIILLAVYILKEKIAWQPKPFSMLDQAPFDCRYCLTTWSLLASYISVAIIIENVWYGLFGVVLSICEALALKYKMKQMTDNDE